MEVMQQLLKLAEKYPIGTELSVAHDGFAGTVRGYYLALEDKPGLVLQLNGARVIHVYSEKWFSS